MTVADCIKCGASVRLPTASDEAEVQCPLCDESFTLSEMLEQLPPMLRVVNDPVAVAAIDHVEEVGEESYAVAPLATESPSFNISPTVDTSSDSSSSRSTSSKPRPGKKRRPRPAKKKKNMFVEVIKIAVGGVVGLTAAMLILWWGVSTDPFSLAPVADKYAATRWIVPPSLRSEGVKSEDDDADGDGEDGKNKKEEKEPVDGGFQMDPSIGDPSLNKKTNDKNDNTKKKKKADDPLSNEPPVNDPFGGPTDNSNPLDSNPLDSNPVDSNPLDSNPVDSNPSDPSGTAFNDPLGGPTTVKDSDPGSSPTSPTNLVSEPVTTSEDLASALADVKSQQKNYLNADQEKRVAFMKASEDYYEVAAALGAQAAAADLAKESASEAETLRLLEELVENSTHMKVLGFQAVNWLDENKSWRGDGMRPNQGAVVAGFFQSVKEQGDYHLAEVVLRQSDPPETTSVLLDKTTEAKPNDLFVALGRVLYDPSSELRGYTGEPVRVVYAPLFATHSAE